MTGQKTIAIFITAIFFIATTGFTLHGVRSCEVTPEAVIVHSMDTGNGNMETGCCVDYMSHFYLTTVYAASKVVSLPDLPSKRVSEDRLSTSATNRHETVSSGTGLIYHGSVATSHAIRQQAINCIFLI